MENEVSLEQWGAELAKEFGYNADSPRVQQRIAETVQQIRDQAPGKSDQELIQTVGPVIKQSIQAAKSPSFSLENYKAQQQQIAQTYSPEEEQKLQERVRRSNLVTQAARAVSTGERLGATAAQQQELQRGYEERMKDNLAPLRDWQQRKQSALKGLEDMAKVGEIEDRQLRTELTRLGVEQQLEERKNRQIQAAAENDPASATSEGMRFLAKKYAPQLAAQLGDNFSRVTAAQLKGMLPALEKEYLKQLEIDQKKLDREGKLEEAKIRAGAAGQSAAARIEAARIAADARTRAAATAAAARQAAAGAPKPPTAATIKLQETQKNAVATAQRGLDIIKGMKEVIAGGELTESGIGEKISQAQEFIGFQGERRKADEQMRGYVDSLVGTLATIDPRAKGSPSNKDIQGIKDTINNPRSTNSEKLRAVERLESILKDVQTLNKPEDMQPAPAAPSITPDEFNRQWANLPKGGSLVGPDGKTYTKK